VLFDLEQTETEIPLAALGSNFDTMGVRHPFNMVAIGY
jgi:hypothetical protein